MGETRHVLSAASSKFVLSKKHEPNFVPIAFRVDSCEFVDRLLVAPVGRAAAQGLWLSLFSNDQQPKLTEFALTDTRNNHQVFNAPKWSIPVSVSHYPFGKHSADAR